MKTFKYILQNRFLAVFLLGALCFASPMAQAQEAKKQKEKEETGEIIMTKEELESLLTKIAEKRKQRLQEQQQISSVPLYPTARPSYDSFMYQEMRSLHSKLDYLLGQSGQPYHVPGATTVNIAPPTGVVVPNENNAVQNPVSSREALPGMTVYFGHDVSVLTASDKQELERLVPQILARQDQILVVLRGFASNVGNAFYNNQLSFRRADAVKEVLITQGVNPKNIMTLFHGEDRSLSPSQARRVEVAFEIINP